MHRRAGQSALPQESLERCYDDPDAGKNVSPKTNVIGNGVWHAIDVQCTSGDVEQQPAIAGGSRSLWNWKLRNQAKGGEMKENTHIFGPSTVWIEPERRNHWSE
jgi:hypothetical protein